MRDPVRADEFLSRSVRGKIAESKIVIIQIGAELSAVELLFKQRAVRSAGTGKENDRDEFPFGIRPGFCVGKRSREPFGSLGRRPGLLRRQAIPRTIRFPGQTRPMRQAVR